MSIRLQNILMNVSMNKRWNSTFNNLSFFHQKMNVNNFLSSSEKQDYDDVIKALNGLQSNASILKKIVPSKHCQTPNIEKTIKYLTRCKIDLELLNGKVIHVSGTKGKGSTCALTESILRSHHYRTGFFSSPHLFSVTERIRINGRPLPKELFVKYFWDIYNTLLNNKDDEGDMPTYFKMLTLLAFKVFISENVDVAVIEVGIGGEYDCTNVLRQPNVAGITSLGYDHMSVLGHTIEEIAWNKGGIMKNKSVVFTCSDQPPSALQVLKDRANEKNCSLFIIDRDYCQNGCKSSDKLVELNCSLAVHLAHGWMHLKNGSSSSPNQSLGVTLPLDKATVKGLESCIWPGRFQIVPKGEVTFYLDGAHTDESMTLCAQWFNQKAPVSERRALVFNLTGSRDARALLRILSTCGFDLACFCPNLLDSEPLNDNVRVKDAECNVMRTCYENAALWREVCNKESRVYSSVTETLLALESLHQGPLHVLVTGSLHLVGNTTFYLQPDIWSLPASN